MCFRGSFIHDITQVEQRYGVTRDPVLQEKKDLFFGYHKNGFDHPTFGVIRQEYPDLFLAGIWGITPPSKTFEELESYYKEASRFGGGLNARSEKVFDHFLYKEAIYSKRCIIPLSGFYEPHKTMINGKEVSVPFFFKNRDKSLLTVAGIYTVLPGGATTFTMLTKPGSPLFSRIHNKKERQIVLLPPELEKEWVENDLNKSQIIELINTDFNDKGLQAYPVTRDLYSRKYIIDDLEAHQPIQIKELNDIQQL